VYIYRSYIGQGKSNLVLSEIPENPAPALHAVKLLALYFAKEENKENVLSLLQKGLSEPTPNPHLQIVGATIYLNENKLEDALKCVFNHSTIEG
jgi:hypothetical protein